MRKAALFIILASIVLSCRCSEVYVKLNDIESYSVLSKPDSCLICIERISPILVLQKAKEQVLDTTQECMDNLFAEYGPTTDYYYIAIAVAYDTLGQYRKAFEAYKQYISIRDIDISHNIKSIKDQYKYEEDMTIQRILLIFSTTAIAIAILSPVLIITRMYKEKKKYGLYPKDTREYNRISKTMEKGTHIHASRRIINERLTLFHTFIASYIADREDLDKKASQELEKLVSDKENFLYSTRIAFEEAYPNFMKHLSEKNLTDNEKNYCCLYLLGLSGKEVGNYIGLQRHYVKYAMPIREKLGLGEHDRNLGPYLKNLSESLDLQ